MTDPRFQGRAISRLKTQSSGRDDAIDIIRGYCIVSMVFGHMAGSTMLSSILHVFPKFDGASGFVLLSGLVLGRVQARRINGAGLSVVQKKTVKRMVFIYGIQVFLVLLGCIAVISGGWRNSNYPPLDGMPFVELLGNSLMMTLAPPGGDVLRLYVFLLGIAMVGYFLLLREMWVVFLGLSLGLHAVAQWYPSFSSFSPFAEQAPSAGWAGWQLLFATALVLGWYWQRLNIAVWIDSNALRVLCVCVCVSVLVLVVSRVVSPEIDSLMFNKYTFPLGRVVAAYSVVTALYVLVRWVLRTFPRVWLRPILMIGKKSLDSYVIQAIAVIVMFGFTSISSSSLQSMTLATLTLFACWLWAEARTRGPLANGKQKVLSA